MEKDRMAALEARIAEAVNAGDLGQVDALRQEWREIYAVTQAAGQ